MTTLREAVETILMNWRIGPDPHMDGLTDAYIVSLDDFYALRAALDEEARNLHPAAEQPGDTTHVAPSAPALGSGHRADHFADTGNMVDRITDEILHRIVAPVEGDVVPVVTPENAIEVAREAANAIMRLHPFAALRWREAIERWFNGWHTVPDDAADPWGQLNRMIAWEQSVGVDPAVSESAAALHAAGYRAALEAAKDEADMLMHYTMSPLRRAKEDRHSSEQFHQEGRWHAANDMAEWLDRKIAAIRSLPEPEGADGWMPIETAPRDGTRFLAIGGGLGSDVDFVRYDVAGGYWLATEYTLDDRDDEADGYSRPTHWRPLPPAPGGNQ